MLIANISKYKTALLVSRIIFLKISAILLFYYGIFDMKLKFFVYLTHWGIIITFLYFLLSVLNYRLNFLDSPVCAMFLIIWTFNWCITLSFWGYLVPVRGLPNITRSVLTHSLPLIMTIVEFSLNRIPFIRYRYLYVLVVMIVYFTSCLLPYTLNVKSIYAGINFLNIISYVIIFAIFVLAAAVLETGRVLRRVINKHQDQSEDPFAEKRGRFEVPLLEISKKV